MKKKSSVSIAKTRLKNLVISDRVLSVTVSYDTLCRELYKVLSKYMNITKDDFKINFERSHIVIHFTGEDL